MPRTKQRFREVPPSDSSSSEEEEDVGPTTTTVVRGGIGGGKQLRMMGRPGGGGKQLRMAPPESESESESEDDAPKPQTTTYGGKYLRPGGKQFRPGGGKQLRVQASESEEEDSDASGSDDDDDDDGGGAQYRPAGGKSLARMAYRGVGKQLRPPPAEADGESESEDSDEEDEPAQSRPAVAIQRGVGKQLRPPAQRKEDEGEEEAEEESDDDMDESAGEDEPAEEEVAPPPSPPPPPPPKANEEKEQVDEPEDMEESSESEKDSEEVSSGSESEEEQELDMETFDTQKLVEDEEDQKRLDALPEFEREAILGERFEKKKRDADMKRALRENKRKEKEKKKLKLAKEKQAKAPASKKKGAPKAKSTSQKKKPKAPTAAADTAGDEALAKAFASRGPSTRDKDASGSRGKKAAALAAIREDRASKAPEKKDEGSDLDYGRDSDDDSDDDYEEGGFLNKPWLQKGKKTSSRLDRKETPSSSDEASEEEQEEESREDKNLSQESADRATFKEAELEDYIKVTLPRRRLMRWCNEPFFKEAVMNFYVRLAIGRDKMTQKGCYRLCQIIGVETDRGEYKFPPIANEKPVTTDKWIKVKFGESVKCWRMHMVSESRPTEEDVQKYVSEQKNVRSNEILSKKAASKLRKIQDDLVHNYTYTKEDIEKSIMDKKKRSRKVMNIGLEKTRTGIAVQGARHAVEEAKKQLEDAKIAFMESADEVEVEQLEKNVGLAEEALKDANADLEAKLAEQEMILKDDQKRRKRVKQSAKVQNWVKVNERARMANQSADYEAYKQQREREKQEAVAAPKFDPYARRKVKPKILWEVGDQKNEEKQSSELSPAVSDQRDGVAEKGPTTNDRDDAHDTTNGDKENKRDDFVGSQKADLVGQSHQFAIDEEDLAQKSGSPSATPGGSYGTRRPRVRVRKGLSLAEYQERKSEGTL